MKKRLNLFLTFLKIGLFTFGGGYAMIALLEDEFVERKKWISHDEFMNLTIVAESTPGPIAINSATYIGYKIGGVLGSAVSTLGVCIPSFTIIYIISLFFDRFMQFEIVAAAFKSIQVSVVYLVFSAGIKMLKNVKKNVFSYILIGLTVIFMVAFSLFSVKFSAIFYILIGAAVGVSAYLIKQLKGEKK